MTRRIAATTAACRHRVQRGGRPSVRRLGNCPRYANVYQQTVNLHTIVTLTSVIVGSQLLGIVGAFLAVPMVAVGWAVDNSLEQPEPSPTCSEPALAASDGPGV